MLDQLQPSTDQFASPTGLRVRQDLYDEEYSDEDYEQMLSMYEGTMAQIVEGEIVKSKVLRVTENAVILVNLSGRGDKDVETAAKWFGLLDGAS